MSPFGRHPFDATVRVVVRRELRMGERMYEPGEPLTDADRAELTTRQLATLWQLGQIDTVPVPVGAVDEDELERLTAPTVSTARGTGQPKQAAARR